MLLDYSNGTCPSLLVEPQRTNIFPKSQTTSTWGFANISRTANNGISPDGTQNADLLFPTTSGAVSLNSDNTASSLVVGQPFVCSFFIKLNTSFTSNVGENIIDLRLSGAAVWTRPTIRVNFETGEVTNVANASYISSTNYGNGWYRITFGAIPTGTGAAVGLQFPTGVTLNGGSFYIWGLQGESNSTYATSYIPTTSASVTRNADAISKTGISSLIGQTEGTIYLEADIQKHNESEFYVAISNGSSLGEAIYLYQPSGGILQVLFRTGGVNETISILNANWNIGYNKIAIAYNSTSGEVFMNGVSQGTVALSALPTCSQLTLGARPDIPGNLVGSGGYKSTAIFKTRLTNAQLASLTSL